MLIMPPNGSSTSFSSSSSSSSSSSTNGTTTHFESSFTGPDGRTVRHSSKQPGPVVIENGVARLVDPRTASQVIASAQAKAGAGLGAGFFGGPSPELLNMSLPALIQAQLLSANALAGQGVPPALVQQLLLQQQLMTAQGGGPGILL